MYQKNRSRIAAFILLISVASPSFGQVVALICKKELTVSYLEKMPKFYEEMCLKYKERNYCDKEKEEREKVDRCIQSKMKHSHVLNFMLNKNNISSQSEEYSQFNLETCWGTKEQRKSVIKANDVIITFKVGDDSEFNVDRSSLLGGWGEDRSWKCELDERKKRNKI